MKNKKHLGISCVMLSALVLASCGGKGYETYPVTGDYLTGKTAKSVYNAYLGSAPTTLDPTVSQNAENVSHLANLIGTLAMNDGYGILRKELAKTASHSEDWKTFSFTIRDEVPWVKSDGSIYELKGAKQYVKAEDFVSTAKIILDFANNSEIYYMYTLFVSNAWEYYCYTMMVKFMNEGKPGYTDLKGNDDKQAAKLTELVRQYSGAEPETPITKAAMPDIRAFKRVGVKAEGGTLTYTLKEKATFFPTMLTYTPFMPTNYDFYKACKGTYGAKKDKLLYCGPYILSELTANSVKYIPNNLYFAKEKVHVKNINYKVVDASVGYADMREAFDRKEVDGFSLSQEDAEGWETYITGPNKDHDIKNPYSGLVNSREIEDVDYTYHFNLNINRPHTLEEKATWSEATYWSGSTAAEVMKEWAPNDEAKARIIQETNTALGVKEIRKLILNAGDLAVFNKQNKVDDNNQYQMNTFTPRGYVFDEEGNDYINKYYEEYAEQKGLTGTDPFTGEALEPITEAGKTLSAKGVEAKILVGPQQIKGVNFIEPSQAAGESKKLIDKYDWLSLAKMRDDAVNAVKELRTSAVISDHISATHPVIVDYLAIGGINTTYDKDEREFVDSWNMRANGCALNAADSDASGYPLCSTIEPSCENKYYPYFQMFRNKTDKQDVWEKYSENGYFTLGSQWGWMGDYADPLTYMHCYVTNGEMSKMSGNTDYFDSYHMEGSTLVKDPNHMLYAYNAIVDEAKAENTSNVERFKKFAAAEYMLLNDLYIMKPYKMSTQGWAASISRAAGYENPSAPYGLANHSMLSMWALEEVPTAEERKVARETQKAKKAEELAKYGNNTIAALFEN